MTSIAHLILLLPLLTSAPQNMSSQAVGMPIWPVAHSSVLTGKQAIALSKQCSRTSPADVRASWKPSASQIAKMEQQLDNYLRQHYPAIRQQIHQSYFQYAGLIRKQHRFIYINVIDEYAQNSPDWRHTAMIICDGGDRFWGLEYDPATEKFSEMKFNSSL